MYKTVNSIILMEYWQLVAHQFDQLSWNWFDKFWFKLNKISFLEFWSVKQIHAIIEKLGEFYFSFELKGKWKKSWEQISSDQSDLVVLLDILAVKYWLLYIPQNPYLSKNLSLYFLVGKNEKKNYRNPMRI